MLLNSVGAIQNQDWLCGCEFSYVKSEMSGNTGVIYRYLNIEVILKVWALEELYLEGSSCHRLLVENAQIVCLYYILPNEPAREW